MIAINEANKNHRKGNFQRLAEPPRSKTSRFSASNIVRPTPIDRVQLQSYGNYCGIVEPPAVTWKSCATNLIRLKIRR